MHTALERELQILAPYRSTPNLTFSEYAMCTGSYVYCTIITRYAPVPGTWYTVPPVIPIQQQWSCRICSPPFFATQPRCCRKATTYTGSTLLFTSVRAKYCLPRILVKPISLCWHTDLVGKRDPICSKLRSYRAWYELCLIALSRYRQRG